MNENTSVEKPNIQERKKTNGWAIASFTLVILGFIPWIDIFSGGYFFFERPSLDVWVRLNPMMGLLSIIFGAIAILSIKKNDYRQKGVGLAIAGIVFGALSFIMGGIRILGFLLSHGII